MPGKMAVIGFGEDFPTLTTAIALRTMPIFPELIEPARNVRSTIQRFGITTKPLTASERLVISRRIGRCGRSALTQSTSRPA